VRTALLSDICEINPPLRHRPANDTMVSFLSMSEVGVDGTTAPGVERPFAEVANTYTHFRQGDVLATSFHPELTDDARVHRLFVDRLDR